MVVCHGSKGPLNNTIENLSYGTPAQNSFDQWRDKTKIYGEFCSWSKLTAKDVIQIKTEYKNGVKNKELAQKFNISTSRVCDIIKGRGWNHLTDDNFSG